MPGSSTNAADYYYDAPGRKTPQQDREGWGAQRDYGMPGFEGGAGTAFGERMRLAAQRGQLPVAMGLTGMQEGLDRSTQSYGQQQQALDYMRKQMAGQGPSVAAIQGQAGQDEALRAMMQHRGQPMLPGAGGGVYAAGNAGAQARGQEIGHAQHGFMGAAGQMRGQSLQERSQNLANAAKYRDVGLSSNQQDLERELALQRMALQGYTMDQSTENARADIALGLQGDEMERNQRYMGAALNAAGQGAGAAASYFGNNPGNEDGPREPKPGGYVGSSDWGSKKGYY